ncbi:hypothetical protein PPL_04600 [Heterostelium album PN500]|uniref:Uncharacterized protein n=1 Tax=Heterostelium pallidum (strain ATCC 26659 / Pp 5 / PN500) TaxID=670386 RepID=D3B810_HETP5|nr:hypothetical protein PPL_04600 [Heterostelium album PN500]EFA82178.1 hypothetical protein PPL_04600 [Heterostelium album PN500]|eukprot:XP_020434295.1 hypothetical protein PPL_04600 [Heterostelium album PN500]
MSNAFRIRIVSFALFGLTWILLVVSFSTFWYFYTDYENGAKRYMWSKFNEMRVMIYENDVLVENYITSWDMTEKTNERSIYRASVAFVILSWIQLTILLLTIGLSFAGALDRISSFPFNLMIRGMSICAVVFSVIAMLVFTGLPAAKLKDCQNTYSDSECNFSDFKHFVYTSKMTRANPDVGWAVIIPAIAFNIGGSVVSFFVNYQE